MNRRLRAVVICIVVAIASTASVAAPSSHEVVLLWPDGAPGAKGTDDGDKPSLTIYLPAEDKANGAAVVICPGGGYGHLAIGSDIANHFCGWSKTELGFIEPILLLESQEHLVLYDIDTHHDSSLYKIPLNANATEYFLLEYRNPRSGAKFGKVDSDFSVYFWPDLAYGGDTLNTIVAARRLGSEAGFITKVGIDPFADFLLSNWRSEGIDLSQTKLVQGFSGIYFISLMENGEREITYFLGQAHWGNGLGTEATQAIIDHAFAALDLERIIGRCAAANRGSRRVLEKCGFQFSCTGMCDCTALNASVASEEFVLERSVWESLKRWGAA